MHQHNLYQFINSSASRNFFASLLTNRECRKLQSKASSGAGRGSVNVLSSHSIGAENEGVSDTGTGIGDEGCL